MLTHLRQARALGARIDEEVRVERVSLRGERPLVETSAGRYECERLIIAPGPWASEVLEELALPLEVTRQQKFYFRPGDREAYAPARLPVYGDVETQFYGFPDYGPGLKVADDGLGEVTSADGVDRTLDEGKREELQGWLESIMPGSGFSYVSGATCMYTVTPDRDFLIGPHPAERGRAGGGRLLWARLQVFGAGGQDPGRAGRGGQDGAAYRALPARPLRDCGLADLEGPDRYFGRQGMSKTVPGKR